MKHLMPRVALGWWLSLCMAGVVLAGAEGLDGPTYQLWERHWRFFAQRCGVFEGAYVCCPTYQARCPSSAGITVRQAQAELAEQVKIKKGILVTTRTVQMPIEEARAMAEPIPQLAVGQYGYLASVQVVQVLGPTSMVVSDVQLIDVDAVSSAYKADRAKAREAYDSDEADQLLERKYGQRMAVIERQKDRSFKRSLLRLEGFATRGLAEGQRWAGPKDQGVQVVMVKQELYGSERRPRVRLVAAILEQVHWGLDEDQFIALLKEHGLEPAEFVQRVMDEMAQAEPTEAQQAVFLSLLPAPPDIHRAQEAEVASEESEPVEEGLPDKP